MPNASYDFATPHESKNGSATSYLMEEGGSISIGQPQSSNTLDPDQVSSPNSSYGFARSHDTDPEPIADCIVKEEVGSRDYASSEGSNRRTKGKEREEIVAAKYETEPDNMPIKGEPDSPKSKRMKGEVIKKDERHVLKDGEKGNDLKVHRSKMESRRRSGREDSGEKGPVSVRRRKRV